jgi:hypothetical protein
MVTESLAQYTSLMVMEKDLGALRVPKFLAYELNKYLKGRGTERDEGQYRVAVDYSSLKFRADDGHSSLIEQAG